MFAEFIKLVIAVLALKTFEGRLPVAPFFLSASAFVAFLSCLFTFFLIIGKANIRFIPPIAKNISAFVFALGIAVLLDAVYALPMQIGTALGLSARDWGIPAVIEIAIYMLLYTSASFPLMMVGGRDIARSRAFFTLRMIAVPLTILICLELALELSFFIPSGILVVFAGFPYATVLLLALVVCISLFLLPILLAGLWAPKSLPPSSLRLRLMEISERARTRFRDIRIWDTFGLRVYNALATGFAMPFRYVLISDAIVDEFPEEHVAAVFAHETSHARFFHFPLLLLGVLGLFSFATAMEYGCAEIGMNPELAALCGLLSIVIYFILIFGPFYRHIERQADVEGALLLGDPSALANALEALSMHVPESKRRASFTHYGLYTRIALLRHGAIDREWLLSLSKQLKMRIGMLVLLIASFMLLGISLIIINKDEMHRSQYMVMSEMLIAKDKLAASARCLEGALAIEHDESLYLYLGLHYAELGQLDKAKAVLDRAKPDELGYYFVLRGELRKRQIAKSLQLGQQSPK